MDGTAIERPIFVAAPKRAGTSMVTELLHRHGAWKGECTVNHRDQTNTEVGGTENQAIKDYCKSLDRVSIPEFRENILSRVDYTQTWVVKNIWLVENWQLFHEAFPEAIWIFPRRPSEEIAQSRKNHVAMQGMDWQSTRKLVKDQLAKQMEAAKNVNEGFMYPSGELAGGNMKLAREIVTRCGLTFDEEATRDWIKPERWHGDYSVPALG